MMTIVAPSHSFLATGKRDNDLFPVSDECTVAQAAEILNGSEGLVNELLRDGLIEYRLENGERLIQRDCLRDYAQDEDRKLAAAAKLFRTFQEAGISDERLGGN